MVGNQLFYYTVYEYGGGGVALVGLCTNALVGGSQNNERYLKKGGVGGLLLILLRTALSSDTSFDELKS